MKKITMSLLMSIAYVLPLFAQVIPDADMESWTSGTGYEQPTGWGTPNPFVPVVIVSKSTDAHGGTYAAELKAYSLGIAVVPGIMVTGVINPSSLTISGGFPVSQAYTDFTGWYKFYPKGGDMCQMLAIFTKWNTNTSSRDTVAAASFTSGSTTSYTQFDASIYYLLTEVPDSAMIIAVTSSNILSGTDSSILFIDDLAFSGATGVPEVKNDLITKAYPNPANDKFTIELPAGNDVKQLEIFGLTGDKIRTMKVESPVITLNTSLMASGLYFYKLEDQKGVELNTGKFSVKH